MHFSPKWFRDRKIAMKLQIETDTQLVQDPLTGNGNSTQEKKRYLCPQLRCQKCRHLLLPVPPV